MHLSDRVVLLTGGSRGLGPVIAERLARQGARLALVARSAESLQEVAASVESPGGRARGFAADLGRAEERERVVEEVLGEFGRVDVLVNNAGIDNDGAAFADMSWEAMQRTIEVNLSAPVHLTRLVLPPMLARGEGHLVHISSLAGKIAIPYDAVYSGTKAALTRWSEGLRREIAGSGVGVSTVSPGYVTERGMFARFGVRPPALTGSCTPEQVASAVEDAILHERPDVIVNSVPMRPAVLLMELFPSLGDWAMRRMGVVEFQQRKGRASREDPG